MPVHNCPDPCAQLSFVRRRRSAPSAAQPAEGGTHMRTLFAPPLYRPWPSRDLQQELLVLRALLKKCCPGDSSAMSSHSEPCTCNLHAQLEQSSLATRRHASYRQLAHAILGPSAPREDVSLARALADHARLLRPASIVTQLIDFKAA